MKSAIFFALGYLLLIVAAVLVNRAAHRGKIGPEK
jgi:hypothetical protein